MKHNLNCIKSTYHTKIFHEGFKKMKGNAIFTSFLLEKEQPLYPKCLTIWQVLSNIANFEQFLKQIFRQNELIKLFSGKCKWVIKGAKSIWKATEFSSNRLESTLLSGPMPYRPDLLRADFLRKLREKWAGLAGSAA